MKILKRNYEHRNLILFLLFSMVYLQAIYSLSHGESLLNLASVKSFLVNHYIILLVNIFTIFAIVNVKKHSDKVLLLCLALITGKNFIMLAASFNKLILGLNFFYLIFAFYFFVVWELEIAKASYNPHFSQIDLEKESRFHLAGKIENLGNGEVVEALITNIDENSCFVLLQSNDQVTKLDPSARYHLVAEYEGVTFVHKAVLVSLYDRGVGLEFEREKSKYPSLNWSDLYKVCLERGLFN